MTDLLHNHIPALLYGSKILASEVLSGANDFANVLYVAGDTGSDANTGTTPTLGFATIQAAINAANYADTIYVNVKKVTAGATDPANYTENLVIPASLPGLRILGMGSGRTQGGLPQLKVGTATTSPIVTIRAAGVLFGGIGVNGAGATGGGVLLDADASTKDAFGANILGCHFKNCVGSTATDCRTGGAIMWSANGGSWQVRIAGNNFYKNVGDVVLKGTSVSVPQDVVIEHNTFQGIASAVDCHLFLTGGGSGMLGVTVDSNTFADVLPALGSGSIVRYADLTGCSGIFSNNYFAGSYTTSGFGAAKAAAKIPTTVGIVHDYSDAGLIVREA
jgi:hypothetical protein